MNSSGDAAESIVRMTLQGMEVAARISGVGAKNIAVLLYTIMKDRKMTKGKTNLTNMLKTGKELKVFSVKQADLKKFTEESKRYGVLYCALVDRKHKQSPDGLVDIMVRAEDASKINRIVERFKLATVDTASIKSVNEKAKIEETLKEAKEKGIEVKTVEDKLVDDILSKPTQKEENVSSNPEVGKTEKSPPSKPSSKNKNKYEGTKPNKNKPSVKEAIKDIKTEQKKQEGSAKVFEKTKDIKQPKSKGKKERGR